MRLAVYACLGLLLTTTSAIGGSKPLYRPAPAWVLPAPMPDPAKADTGPLVIFDQQQRLANGQVWAYVDGATRITSEQALTQNGTVSVQWQPDEGDLIVHRIAIQRGQQQINLLADPEPLTVLRRERGLEALAIDGVLTATMPVKGLQIGDILRVSYSVTRADPALKGNMQSLAALIPDQTQVGFARARILWPVGQDVRWKLLAKANATSLTTIGGDRQLTVALPLPKPPELPADAPARFQPVAVLELSTFRDWTDVSRTMAPLFRPVPPAAGSPLATEIARLKAAAPDQRTRAALALQSVQGNVRYLFNGLDHGNYVPQPPETTWAVRYGDCKAKTVLLLTMLDALGVPAEPVLANLQAGDLIPSRLPSASAFNHILVRATIDGQVYWMDGTGGGARLADLADTPNLRHVLPLRAGGAGLMPVATHPNARPNVSIAIDIDQTAGIGLPAPVTLDVTLRGPLVEALKTANAQLTGDKRKEVIDKFVGGLGLRVLATRRDVTFDAADGSARIRVVGLTELGWQREDQRYATSLDGLTQAIRFDGDRGRPEWRAIPVATPGVESRLARRAVRLPQGVGDFTLEGDRTLPSHLAGYTVHRTAELANNVVTVEDRIDATAAEVAPADIPDVRAKLALARSRTLKVTAPRDYPARWRMIEAAGRAGKLKPIEAAFTAAIADAPEKPPAYLNRALFRRGVYDRKGALADLDIVVAQRPTVPALLLRAQILWSLRQGSQGARGREGRASARSGFGRGARGRGGNALRKRAAIERDRDARRCDRDGRRAKVRSARDQGRYPVARATDRTRARRDRCRDRHQAGQRQAAQQPMLDQGDARRAARNRAQGLHQVDRTRRR